MVLITKGSCDASPSLNGWSKGKQIETALDLARAQTETARSSIGNETPSGLAAPSEELAAPSEVSEVK